MAGNGRGARKGAGSVDLLKDDGQVRGFDLPDDALPVDPDTGERETWHPMTKKWWDAWRKSPQATQMVSEPDWFFLLDTALIHHRMWSNGRWEFANEVRMRVASFGATPAHRKQLKMELETPDPYAVGAVKGDAVITEINSRRDRLAAV